MTHEQKEAVIALDAMELPVSKIASVLGLHRDSVRRVIDPEYAERRCNQVRINGEARTARQKHGNTHNVYRNQVETDAIRLRREIPEDGRDFTGRFCGDPLPGRSALDRKPS